MKASGIKLLVAAIVLLMATAGVAQALTLNAGDTLTATFENLTPGEEFGSFSFFWELSGWGHPDTDFTDMDYNLYPPGSSLSIFTHDLDFLGSLEPQIFSARSDFTFAESYDFLTLEFIVKEGWVSFSDEAKIFNNDQEDEYVSGALAAQYYTGIKSASTAVGTDVYVAVAKPGGGGYKASPVPEPGTWLLLSVGFIGLAIVRQKKRVAC